MSVEHGDPGFDAAAIGRRVRQVRQAKGMSLRELGAKAGLSYGSLAQVERGLSSLAHTYVLEGEPVATVNGVDHLLGPGESVHLRSSIPHSIRNDRTATVTVVSVLTPRLS
ncbi:XRE family transcriptional regulator [Sphaerisporangium sp. NPDC051011]|uniref:helix-turn-helix domain-containing protein n=1 Tax=Sphaerisporangium sp. NPDC051011 TaxID=3155792 RepID=UPI0033CCF2EB